MSNASNASPHDSTFSANVPRAVIHKKILDVGKAQPKASIKEIADEVSGASVELVEKVFEEYGDPAENGAQSNGGSADSTAENDENSAGGESATATKQPEDQPDTTPEIEQNNNSSDGESGVVPEHSENQSEPTPQIAQDEDSPDGESTVVTEPTESQSEPSPAFGQLTEIQRETLLAIRDDPEATQADLAGRLGVSSATICQRVNSIQGFDWADRKQCIAGMTETENLPPKASMEETTSTPELTDRIDELTAKIDALEQRLESRIEVSTNGAGNPPVFPNGFDSPELTHKVVHACFQSEHITEDEELAILRAVMGGNADD